ncbi:MAG: ribosomal protein L7/L12 [Treponema sp.]|nr:ribosomal protein L7/L12 [Treponema sp.]
MSMRSFRKGLVLAFAELVIIIGIFILQFRTDSTIIEKIGGLQVTLEKLESPENNVALQNKMIVNYNGLNFYSDDQNSAKVLFKGKSKPQDIQVINWEKDEGQGVTVFFTNDIALFFDLSSPEAGATLSVSTDIPEEIDALMLPYSFAYNMDIQKDEGNKVLLTNKNITWNFTTNQVKDGFIYFTGRDSMAHYSVYDDTKKFTFDVLTELAAADQDVFNRTVSSLKTNLISSFKKVVNDEFTELSAIAYVAAMAEDGKYQQAIDEIPSSYKKSDKRTYLSAPYFNNLSKMNTTIDREIKKKEAEVTKAAETLSLEAFNSDDFAAYLSIYPNANAVRTILQNAANADTQLATIAQATGVIKTYVNLRKYNPDFAAILAPAMENYVEKLASACTFENNELKISENDQFLSVLQAVDTGVALMRYGLVSNQQTYVKAGRVIVNTYIPEGISFDLRTLTTLYPILAFENWYYPHFEMIKSDPADLMWAWTCAEKITYTQDKENGLTLSIKFPESYIHHVIFKGIPKFNAIYIYNMAYRTDPRFETYNSSGYVYKEDGYSLLLKSRHKEAVETVRMTYPNGVAPKKNNQTAASSGSGTTTTASEQRAAATANYTVTLEEAPGGKKRTIVQVIRSVRPDLSSTEANNLFSNVPSVIKENMTSAEADELIAKLEEAGGKASKKK